VFPDGLMALVTGLYSDVATVRGRQNKAYLIEAIGALKIDPEAAYPQAYHDRFPWLFGADRTNGSTWRFSVLAELGRIRDPEEIVAAAEELCRIEPPSTKAAIALVREWRGARRADPSAHRLHARLARTIEGYLDEYPDTTFSGVLQALALLYADFSEAASANRDDDAAAGRP
jgi:hypothetical protein